MKKTLKGLAVCLVLALCCMLTACDPADYWFDYDELKENVIGVELIYYDNPDAKIVKKRDEVLPFDFDKVEVIGMLESEQMDVFLYELSKMRFHICDDLTEYSSSAYGISFRITYNSGDFVILCSNIKSEFLGEFNVDGEVDGVIGYILGPLSFPDLLNTYFKVQIE